MCVEEIKAFNCLDVSLYQGTFSSKTLVRFVSFSTLDVDDERLLFLALFFFLRLFLSTLDWTDTTVTSLEEDRDLRRVDSLASLSESERRLPARDEVRRSFDDVLFSKFFRNNFEFSSMRTRALRTVSIPAST